MTKTHLLPTGTISQSSMAVPPPDLLDLIQTTAPNKDGMSILMSLAGSVEMRIAKLAAMVTNTMAGFLRIGDGEHPAIDKFNEAMIALDEDQARTWAFKAAGIAQVDMVNDLRALINFRLKVIERLTAVSGKPFMTRWHETIERAGTPQAVEAWKLEMSWAEYIEGCHGKPEMTEDEFKKIESANLTGTKQTWHDHAPQIIDTIEHLTGEPIEFDELSVDMQKRLLESISSEDKEQRFRTSALKLARSPADLHVRRQFISSFCAAVRNALTHARYAEASPEPEKTDESSRAALEHSIDRRRQSHADQSKANREALADMASDPV